MDLSQHLTGAKSPQGIASGSFSEHPRDVGGVFAVNIPGM